MSIRPEVRARLNAQFLAGLPDRLDAMLAVRARLTAGDPTAAAGGRTLGHQLAGTGASFGHPQLTDQGRVLERAVDEELLPALDLVIASVRATLEPVRRA